MTVRSTNNKMTPWTAQGHQTPAAALPNCGDVKRRRMDVPTPPCDNCTAAAAVELEAALLRHTFSAHLSSTRQHKHQQHQQQHIPAGVKNEHGSFTPCANHTQRSVRIATGCSSIDLQWRSSTCHPARITPAAPNGDCQLFQATGAGLTQSVMECGLDYEQPAVPATRSPPSLARTDPHALWNSNMVGDPWVGCYAPQPLSHPHGTAVISTDDGHQSCRGRAHWVAPPHQLHSTANHYSSPSGAPLAAAGPVAQYMPSAAAPAAAVTPVRPPMSVSLAMGPGGRMVVASGRGGAGAPPASGAVITGSTTATTASNYTAAGATPPMSPAAGVAAPCRTVSSGWAAPAASAHPGPSPFSLSAASISVSLSGASAATAPAVPSVERSGARVLEIVLPSSAPAPRRTATVTTGLCAGRSSGRVSSHSSDPSGFVMTHGSRSAGVGVAPAAASASAPSAPSAETSRRQRVPPVAQPEGVRREPVLAGCELVRQVLLRLLPAAQKSEKRERERQQQQQQQQQLRQQQRHQSPYKDQSVGAKRLREELEQEASSPLPLHQQHQHQHHQQHHQQHPYTTPLQPKQEPQPAQQQQHPPVQVAAAAVAAASYVECMGAASPPPRAATGSSPPSPGQPAGQEGCELPAQPAGSMVEHDARPDSTSEKCHANAAKAAQPEPALSGLEGLLEAAAAATATAAALASSARVSPTGSPSPAGNAGPAPSAQATAPAAAHADTPRVVPSQFFQPDGSLLAGAVLQTACNLIRVVKGRSSLAIALPWGNPAAASGTGSAGAGASATGSSTGGGAARRNNSAGGPPAGWFAALENPSGVPLHTALQLLVSYAGAARALQLAEARLLAERAAVAEEVRGAAAGCQQAGLSRPLESAAAAAAGAAVAAVGSYRALWPLMRRGYKCAEKLMGKVERALTGEVSAAEADSSPCRS